MASTDKPPGERDATDLSLQAERQKTDHELSNRTAAIEEEANKVLEVARERADNVLTVARAKADAGSPIEVTATLRATRASEDRALSQERASADVISEKARKEHDAALARLLAMEREQTDDHLLAERAVSDRSVASRDDFLAMVSHDARNFLSGIAMSAFSLSHREHDHAFVQTEAQRILRLSARMNRLVSDLLDVSSMESGKLRVQFDDNEVAKLIVETMDGFRAAAAAKQIQLTANVASSGVSRAAFDRDRILQVLSNLMSNAIKFTKTGGRIALGLEAVGDTLQFTVTDDGVGIPSEQIESIFERFWTTARHNHLGLGLGLYISRCIVDAHGGKIRVESKEGGGSSFLFTIPVAQPGQALSAS